MKLKKSNLWGCYPESEFIYPSQLKLVESVANELEHTVNQMEILYNDITKPVHTLTVI
jgi:hypothetical protein